MGGWGYGCWAGNLPLSDAGVGCWSSGDDKDSREPARPGGPNAGRAHVTASCAFIDS